MFEKSIAAVRAAFPDQMPTVAFIGGTFEQRNAFRERGLIDFKDTQRLDLANVPSLRHNLVGRVLAGAVIFERGIVEQIHGTLSACLASAATVTGVTAGSLVHYECAEDEQPSSNLFRHTDGGLYEFMHEAKSSVDQSPVIVYKHMWPFETSIWVRPKHEWVERFAPISLEEYAAYISESSREHAQQCVASRRSARKLAKEKAKQGALERLGISSVRVTLGPKLGPAVDPTARFADAPSPDAEIIEKLEERNIYVNSILFDAHGVQWVVRGRGDGTWALSLIQLQDITDGATTMQSNHYLPDGTQFLFWDNPVNGLKFKWLPSLVNGQQTWTTQTAFGPIQVHQGNAASRPGRLAWFLRYLPGAFTEGKGEDYPTNNEAMRQAEVYINKRLQQESPK